MAQMVAVIGTTCRVVVQHCSLREANLIGRLIQFRFNDDPLAISGTFYLADGLLAGSEHRT